MVFLVALGVSAALLGALIPVLRWAQFIDVPNHRSSHATPIPRGGGIAVLVAASAGLLLAERFDGWMLVLVAAGLGVVGLVDDLRSLPSLARLGAQVAAAVAVCSWLLVQGHLDAWWMLVVSCVVLVGFVNAFNFMDGVNGISALTTAAIGAYWAVVAVQEELPIVGAVGLALAGAALGFLPWNAPRARVFLGDVGSYGIGMLVGALSVVAWAQGVHWLVAIAPLTVYGADTGWVLIKRARGRRPLMEAHREHVYQRVVDGGWSHLGAALLCAGAVGVVCMTAVLSWRSAPAIGVLAVAVVTFGYLATPQFLERVGRPAS